MYAIIRHGSHQYRLAEGDSIAVQYTPGAPGSTVTLEDVLLARKNGTVVIGQPFVKGARVICEVQRQEKAKKVIAFRFRRRENVRRKRGHRQQLTRLLVKTIEWSK